MDIDYNFSLLVVERDDLIILNKYLFKKRVRSARRFVVYQAALLLKNW